MSQLMHKISPRFIRRNDRGISVVSIILSVSKETYV